MGYPCGFSIITSVFSWVKKGMKVGASLEAFSFKQETGKIFSLAAWYWLPYL